MHHVTARFFLGILPCLFLLIPAAVASDFIPAVQAWQEKHTDALEQANAFSLKGESDRANRMLIELAGKESGGVTAFVIGNMLYRSDPAISFSLHRRALDAYPAEPAANLEMAMELHRKGEYDAAIPLYRRALEGGMPEHFSCLLAECLIRTGKSDDAVKAWNEARHGSNHTSIDFAIFEIHGELMPNQRRGDLLARIQAGERDKLTDLILLDLRFDRDWWNAEVFEEGLEHDLTLAKKLLGEKDPCYRQLALYAKLARQEELPAHKARTELTGAKLIVGQGAALPGDSRLARALCEIALRSEAASAADLLKSLSPELRTRLVKKDRDALHLLCLLAAHAEDPHLAELDRMGWKEWQDPAFAVSYVADLAQAGKLTSPDDPELLAAMKAMPDDHHLCLLRLRLAGEKSPTREMLLDAIKAEYHRLSDGMIIPDSYTLKSLYHLLAKNLGMVDGTTSEPE